MSRPNQTATRFISAVHRRLVLLRALEHIGRGMMIASALAIVLVCLAIWQSMPTAPVLTFCGALGLLIGLSLAIYRWPTRLSAAAETDRQLRLQDLFTTSMLLSASADDFAQAVVVMADVRCRLHSPSEVVLRQLGIRSWSGIGVTMAIAATLAAIPLGPSRSQATDVNISVLSENPMQPPGANSMQQSHRTVTHVNNPQSDNASSDAMSVERSTEDSAANVHSAPTNPGNTAGANGGSTSTAAGSHEKFESANSAGRPQNSTGTTAGGGDASGSHAGNGEPGGGTERVTDRSSTPKANIDGGSNAGSPTISSPEVDRVPPADRDLVRDFFGVH